MTAQSTYASSMSLLLAPVGMNGGPTGLPNAIMTRVAFGVARALTERAIARRFWASSPWKHPMSRKKSNPFPTVSVGSWVTSAWTKVALTPAAAARLRARSSALPMTSTPVTSQPRCASVTACKPDPQPRSRALPGPPRSPSSRSNNQAMRSPSA